MVRIHDGVPIKPLGIAEICIKQALFEGFFIFTAIYRGTRKPLKIPLNPCSCDSFVIAAFRSKVFLFIHKN